MEPILTGSKIAHPRRPAMGRDDATAKDASLHLCNETLQEELEILCGGMSRGIQAVHQDGVLRWKLEVYEGSLT
jgi:hypothetical protein